MSSTASTITTIILVILFLGGSFFLNRRLKSDSEYILVDFFIWVIFSVIFALLPIALNASVSLILKKEITLNILLRNGELLIICAAISAEASGRLILANIQEKLVKVIIVGACFIIVAFSSGLFAVVASGSYLDLENTASVSIITFIVTMLTSGCAVILASEYKLVEKKSLITGKE